MSAGVTNWLCWWSAIEEATLADFPHLALLAKSDPTALRLVAERWVELAPLNFFQTLAYAAKKGVDFPADLPGLLFDSWLKRDKDAAISALESAEDFPMLADWRREMASDVIRQDPERGLRLFSEWHIETPFSTDLNAVRTWAAANPAHAAEFAIANPAGFATSGALRVIGEEWAKTAPTDALSFALAQKGQFGSALANAILQRWAARDFNAAADWLTNADPSTRDKLNPSMVQTWATQDPSGALAWCETNLTGSSLALAVGGVFKGAAEHDLSGAAQLVLGLQPSRARSEAAVTVANHWFTSLGKTDKAIPSDALSWLSSLDPNSLKCVLNEVSSQWARSDPTSMASFIQSIGNTEVPGYSYSILGQNMARKDPLEAVEWANQLPGGAGIQAGSSAFNLWARSQPDLAMNWWSSLDLNDPRRQTFYASLLQQLAWDPQNAGQFAQFSALDPAAARKAIAGMQLEEQRSSMLLSLVPKE